MVADPGAKIILPGKQQQGLNPHASSTHCISFVLVLLHGLQFRDSGFKLGRVRGESDPGGLLLIYTRVSGVSPLGQREGNEAQGLSYLMDLSVLPR